jgi:hypothetical protein
VHKICNIRDYTGQGGSSCITVAEILNTQEASVMAPKLNKVARGKRTCSPTSFLIYNITDEQADMLLQCRVWSSKVISFRAAPFATTCPSYFFALSGLGMITMKEVYPIMKRVWDSKETKNFIDTLTNNIPPGEQASIYQDLENIINSVNLAHLDTKDISSMLAPHFNIYADCTNFSYDKLWSCLRTFLEGCAYMTKLKEDTNTERSPYQCSCCHSIDHPRGLCPFPNLTGWNSLKRERSITCRGGMVMEAHLPTLDTGRDTLHTKNKKHKLVSLNCPMVGKSPPHTSK